jgi:hypothetical protein
MVECCALIVLLENGAALVWLWRLWRINWKAEYENERESSD